MHLTNRDKIVLVVGVGLGLLLLIPYFGGTGSPSYEQDSLSEQDSIYGNEGVYKKDSIRAGDSHSNNELVLQPNPTEDKQALEVESQAKPDSESRSDSSSDYSEQDAFEKILGDLER